MKNIALDPWDLELILDALEYDKARQDNHEVIAEFDRLIGYLDKCLL